MLQEYRTESVSSAKAESKTLKSMHGSAAVGSTGAFKSPCIERAKQARTASITLYLRQEAAADGVQVSKSHPQPTNQNGIIRSWRASRGTRSRAAAFFAGSDKFSQLVKLDGSNVRNGSRRHRRGSGLLALCIANSADR